jgi:hypothetical protein
MNKKTIVAIVLTLLVELPFWFYLIYWILSQLHPDRLIWFLFLIYVPIVIITTILGKVIAGEKE